MRNADSSDEKFDYSSNNLEESSNNSGSVYSSDDDIDTVIDYVFDIKKVMNSQPARMMVAIVGKLLITTLDTGGAISVMS